MLAKGNRRPSLSTCSSQEVQAGTDEGQGGAGTGKGQGPAEKGEGEFQAQKAAPSVDADTCNPTGGG